MYSPSYFRVQSEAAVLRFMHAHPFVTIVGHGQDGWPAISHIPVLIAERNEQLYLQGHIQRKTDHHLSWTAHPQVTAVFTGPHSYVSASLYPQPNTASTWNYTAVHAKGHLQWQTDEWLLQMLNELTAHFEQDPNSPAQMRHMTDEYVQTHVKAIVGFEIEVTELQHVFKLSQNKDAATQLRIAESLLQSANEADRAVGKLMLQSLSS